MNKDITRIWQQFGDNIKAFILKRIDNKNEADDILQEVFIKIHTKIETLKDENKLHVWIYQIARNTINDHYRKLKSDSQISDRFIEEETLEENESMIKIAEGLHKFMNEIPPNYCDAICKTEFEGQSQVEYAKEMGLSNSGAKSRVQRGRQMIKDMLMKCCHFQFDKYGTIIDYHPIKCCCCHQYFLDHPEEKEK